MASKFVDYSQINKLTHRKATNPKGAPLRRMDDTELAKFINQILDRGNLLNDDPFTLKELAKRLDIHYQGLWSAYNSYRKLPLEEFIKLHGFWSQGAKDEANYTLDAVKMYFAQGMPTRGIPEKTEAAPIVFNDDDLTPAEPEISNEQLLAMLKKKIANGEL